MPLNPVPVGRPDFFVLYSHALFALPRSTVLASGCVPTYHYESILASSPSVDWFEILSENYLVPRQAAVFLDRVRENATRSPKHGVSLSIAFPRPIR